ncbi:uncharacterized protein [Primulina eburnea]|uniref:uncharacterized protein n=1 Tax=Primulina eburnea TaxID=1245227 RepID=UPI003C6C44B5
MRWLLLTFLLFSTCLISEAPGKETRKLMMTHNVSTTTTAKNSKNQANKSLDPNSDTDSPSKSKGSEEDGHLFVKSSSISEQRHSSTSTDGQEKLDIVEMDYTLARRKPHIHN